MANKTTPVGCNCGWRGRRVRVECACYDEWAQNCRCHWGSCPKCGGRVETTANMREWAQQAKEAMTMTANA